MIDGRLRAAEALRLRQRRGGRIAGAALEAGRVGEFGVDARSGAGLKGRRRLGEAHAEIAGKRAGIRRGTRWKNRSGEANSAPD